jgi:hypothetical protein
MIMMMVQPRRAIALEIVNQLEQNNFSFFLLPLFVEDLR